MPRPLWTAREIIELTYKRSIKALLQLTVNLYLFHKSEQAFLEAVAKWTAGEAFSNYADALAGKLITHLLKRGAERRGGFS